MCIDLVIYATWGRVLQSLHRGEKVVGVTSLDNHLYLLRSSMPSDQLEVFDKDTYRLQRKLTVPGYIRGQDITACEHNRCAYISDGENRCVRRVALPDADAVTRWPVNDTPAGLSVTASHSVLVTCIEVRKVKEFSTDGLLLRQLQLPEDIFAPHHTVQLSSQQLLVCHGEYFDLQGLHRVCLIASNGQVVKSYGRSRGSGSKQMNGPGHLLAVDRNKFVFAVDRGNSRVLLLSPSLTYVRDMLSHNQLEGYPESLYLDENKRRLYVAVNDFDGGGRVVVVNVNYRPN